MQFGVVKSVLPRSPLLVTGPQACSVVSFAKESQSVSDSIVDVVENHLFLLTFLQFYAVRALSPLFCGKYSSTCAAGWARKRNHIYTICNCSQKLYVLLFFPPAFIFFAQYHLISLPVYCIDRRHFYTFYFLRPNCTTICRMA